MLRDEHFLARSIAWACEGVEFPKRHPIRGPGRQRPARDHEAGELAYEPGDRCGERLCVSLSPATLTTCDQPDLFLVRGEERLVQQIREVDIQMAFMAASC